VTLFWCQNGSKRIFRQDQACSGWYSCRREFSNAQLAFKQAPIFTWTTKHAMAAHFIFIN
jgi:hypothetical protein